MLPPVPNPSEFGITPDYGFLSPELPLEILPDTYYAKWENIIGNLHPLILSKRLQSAVDHLPILSVAHLQTDAEWRRAYVILVFILHGYVWGGNSPTEVPAHPIGLQKEVDVLIYFISRGFHLNLQSPYSKSVNDSNYLPWQPMRESAFGITSQSSPTNQPPTWKT